MPLTNIKKHILNAAKDAFAQQTGFTLDLAEEMPGKQILILKAPEATVELEAIVIEGGTPAIIAALIHRQRLENRTRFVIVVPHVIPEMADKLRLDDIQFIDTAGNGYIHQSPLHVFIKGNKTQEIVKISATGRTFKQTGLRILYALLCNPGLENETYRTIAAKANVALGMVNWILKELKELGFLMETGKGRARQVRLMEKEKLLDRWITAYAEQLRPKLVQGRYRGAEGWWQGALLNPENALWGGEVAAAKLTGYLKPQNITVYVDKEKPEDVIIPNRLKKDLEGDVELLYRFWQPDTIPPHGDTVHPILVYADLMATGNQRNMETARIIYDEHIVQLFRDN